MPVADQTIAKRFERLTAAYAAAKAEADKAKEELDRCRDVLNSHTATVEDVRNDIYRRMQKLKIGVGASIHTTSAMLSLSNGPISVEVLDIGKVPDSYIRRPEPQVDRAAVLKQWRETNKRVPGTRVVEGDPVLTIRL